MLSNFKGLHLAGMIIKAHQRSSLLHLCKQINGKMNEITPPTSQVEFKEIH